MKWTKWPPVGVGVGLGWGIYRNIEFWGNFKAHSHIINICNAFFYIKIPKHTLISVKAFLVLVQKRFEEILFSLIISMHYIYVYKKVSKK